MMAQLYGHRWVSSYGAEVDTLGVWRATLKGVSAADMRQAFTRLVDSGNEWPPSAPEFAALCRNNYGLPPLADVTASLIAAVKDSAHVRVHDMTRHVYAVWRELDAYAFRLADDRAMRGAVKAAYESVCNRLKAGLELPEVPLPLPKPERKPASREAALSKMESLKGILHD